MEKQHRYTVLFDQKSRQNAEKGLQLMLQNELHNASEYFQKAILYNRNDLRHYLNRCYCYLGMGCYELALADAEHVIHSVNHIDKSEHSYLANLRAGQALLALEEYEKAEKYLEEATNMNLENLHAKRELMRVKVSHIVSKGFREKDALLALEQNLSILVKENTLEAINYLKEKQVSLDSAQNKTDIEMINANYDDVVYFSDEDEKVNKIQNVSQISTNHNQTTNSLSESKVALDPAPSTNERKTLNNPDEKNNKTIWIGNLSNLITIPVLLKSFRQFGKISSIYKDQNANHAFIIFEHSEDAQKVLERETYELMSLIVKVEPAKKLIKVQSVSQISTKDNQTQNSLSESKVALYHLAPSVNEKITLNNPDETNNKTIWIGNLSNLITIPVLLKSFRQFGKISSIYKGQNANYAFIKFEHSEDAQKVLEREAYELMSRIVIVQPAVRSKHFFNDVLVY